MPCEADHRNPNLKLFSFLTILLTSKLLQKLLGVHVYTHGPLLDPPQVTEREVRKRGHGRRGGGGGGSKGKMELTDEGGEVI
jgi:hypothetical protein